MNAAGLLLGFVDVVINCVIIFLVAVTIVWLLGIAGYPPSADMLKFGKLLVFLLCLAVVLAWLLGGGGFFPHYFSARHY
jgi:hypothetical protein